MDIYTIGHGNAPGAAIVDLLRKYEIAELVDVRSTPYSQYNPDFNRELFKKAVEAAGIKYTFAGEYLGGRPKDPALYKNEEVPDETTGRAKFLKIVDYDKVAHSEGYQRGIARLIEIAQTHRTAIMCSEEDPKQCHRSRLIARTLREKDIAVWHIRRDGGSELDVPEPKQLGLF